MSNFMKFECRKCKSEINNDICDQGKIQIGSGKFSVVIALSKFFDQLYQALSIAGDDNFRLLGQSEENELLIKNYEHKSTSYVSKKSKNSRKPSPRISSKNSTS